jgi:hypothetical protein
MKNHLSKINIKTNPGKNAKKREPRGSPSYSAVNGSKAILRARLIATVTWR